MVQYFTKEGLAKLKEELKDIKENQVRETKRLIKEAAAFGDLKENSAYHDARDKMSFIKGRIEQLESAINEAVIKPACRQAGKIGIGSGVAIDFGGQKETYTIVNPTEADILHNKISYQSPLGQQLLGQKVGGEFTFGDKKIKVKILEIK